MLLSPGHQSVRETWLVPHKANSSSLARIHGRFGRDTFREACDRASIPGEQIVAAGARTLILFQQEEQLEDQPHGDPPSSDLGAGPVTTDAPGCGSTGTRADCPYGTLVL